VTARDPALLPGPSAGEWLGRARLALGVGVAPVLVALVLRGAGVDVPLGIVIAAAVVAVAGFVGWVAAGQAATRRMREERDAGYATAADVPGLARRHPTTGALERAADVEPTEEDRSLLRRLLSAPSRWTGPERP
jgi:hypothetical protein